MPLFESESIVLRSYNLSEADRIVLFFTREHGMVRGVAKGAKRLKSRFGSTLELFSTINLTYFQKEDRELVSVQNIDLKKSRFESASDPEFLRTFSYLSELLVATVPPHDPSEKVYRMTAVCLDAAAEAAERLPAIRLYFELWLLRLGGFLPDWAVCGQCSRELAFSERAYVRPDFHLICDACRGARKMTEVSDQHRQIFQSVQQLDPASFADNVTSISLVNEVSDVMRRIASQVIGREVGMERTAAVNN